MVTEKSSKKRPPPVSAGKGETLFQILEKARLAIPAEEAARHPRDGAMNLDHYLYGTPKQETE